MSTITILRLVFYCLLTLFVIFQRIKVHRAEMKANGRLTAGNLVLTVVLLGACAGLFLLRF